MSVFKKLLFGAGGAALLASGLASGAQAHTVVGASATGSCELYAQQYAGAYAPQFGAAGWDDAYRFAYNRCVAGGPSFVVTPVAGAPYGYNYGYNYGLGGAIAAPVYAGANIAGSAIQAGATVAGSAIQAGAGLAGAALSIPGTVLGGLFGSPATSSAALAPVPAAAPVEPVVRKNYRGTFEEPQVVVADETLTSTAALAVPVAATAPAAQTPEWYEYCAAKYRSFNPETGMYLAYSGQYRMCN